MSGWRSFLQGLSGTRQQVTYAVMGAYIAIVLRGLSTVRSVDDVVKLMGAMDLVVMATMVYWFGGKWLEGKNGSSAAVGDKGSSAGAGQPGKAP